MNALSSEYAIYDVASNKWLTNSALENFRGNAAVSANGTVIVTGSGLLDSEADVPGSLAWQEVFQSPGPSFSLPLEKIPDGGSLVYMPRASSTAFNVTRPSEKQGAARRERQSVEVCLTVQGWRFEGDKELRSRQRKNINVVAG